MKKIKSVSNEKFDILEFTNDNGDTLTMKTDGEQSMWIFQINEGLEFKMSARDHVFGYGKLFDRCDERTCFRITKDKRIINDLVKEKFEIEYEDDLDLQID